MSNELITLKFDRILDSRETRLSWCFVFGDETVYLPKSQVEDIRETCNEVDIPHWLAEAKGLECYEV
ncbi:MAG: hypothetical protein D4R73_09250 [Deltaproteobacteria bacterium]|nr:MAG: hypothetical protein D4R73_09250 [Deltaproteobacteria bacterium]